MARVIVKSILFCFAIEILCGVNGKNIVIGDLMRLEQETRGYGDLPGSKSLTEKGGESAIFVRENFQNPNFYEAADGNDETGLLIERETRKVPLYGETEEPINDNRWQTYRAVAPWGQFRNRRLYEDRRYLTVPGHNDFISNRSFLPPDSKRSRGLKRKTYKFRNRYNLRIPFMDPFTPSRSVRMFKRMKKKLLTRTENENYQVSDSMNVQTTNEVTHTPEWQYKCKVGTSGVLGVKDGRMVGSRGLTYSEDDGNGGKSLLCRAETSETFRPDKDTFVKNSVTGINVVTTDYDPMRFLERNEINSDLLEIGSKGVSALESSSNKNQSVSVVSTQDRNADSQTRVGTKFIYENGARTAFESKSDVQGSTLFNTTNGQTPLILTGKQESSSVVQNTQENSSEEKSDNTVTFMNFKKKTDFDIAFRNLFDY